MLGLKEGNVFVDDTVKMLSKAIIMSSAAACGMVVVRPGVKKKTDCYENIDQRNSTELGRGRASWGEYDAMQ